MFALSGKSHLTVFNDQAEIQVGGVYRPGTSSVLRPFIGVLAGVLYNGVRPLDIASKTMGSSGGGGGSKGTSEVHGDVK